MGAVRADALPAETRRHPSYNATDVRSLSSSTSVDPAAQLDFTRCAWFLGIDARVIVHNYVKHAGRPTPSTQIHSTFN